MTQSKVLTLSDAVRGMAALDELHRVCLAMDCEREDERPTEDEYQAAMAEAGGALKAWAPHKPPNARVA
jgi:hypothetical protein